MPGSQARLAAAVRAGPDALADGLALLATHDSAPQAVCRHDEPSGEPDTPLVGTVVSVAMRPGVPELRVAAGQPCEYAFLDYAV
jgi:isopenicillin-N N-acyltransferase-like protein